MANVPGWLPHDQRVPILGDTCLDGNTVSIHVAVCVYIQCLQTTVCCVLLASVFHECVLQFVTSNHEEANLGN